jgi:hypothetical protein
MATNLGSDLWDFDRMTMRFEWLGRDMVIRGLRSPLNRVVEGRNLSKELKKNEGGGGHYFIQLSK